MFIPDSRVVIRVFKVFNKKNNTSSFFNLTHFRDWAKQSENFRWVFGVWEAMKN